MKTIHSRLETENGGSGMKESHLIKKTTWKTHLRHDPRKEKKDSVEITTKMYLVTYLISVSNGLMKGEPLIVCVLTI